MSLKRPSLHITSSSKRFKPLLSLSHPALNAPNILHAAASQASFRDLEEACSSQVHQGISVGFLPPSSWMPPTSLSAFLGGGKELVVQEIWSAIDSFFFSSGEKGLDSPDSDAQGSIQQMEDGTCGWAEATILASGQEKEPGARERPLRRGSSPTSNQLEFLSRCHFSGISPASKGRLRRAHLCQLSKKVALTTNSPGSDVT